MALKSFLAKHKLPSSYISIAELFFIPLASEVKQLSLNIKKPLMIGINGCQGSGKSTLVDFLAAYLSEQYQLKTVTLSIDDFYYDRAKRTELAQDVHTLLATRGVPGTHDSQLLKSTLVHLKEGKPTAIPRFNKATDEPLPENEWTYIENPVDVVLVEGWCWGIPPQQSFALSKPINDLEKYKDQSYVWREYVNKQLRDHYLPLYDYMHKWVMLKAPSFGQVLTWRWQQEQMLAAMSVGKDNQAVMDKDQVTHFISYFQRLTEHALEVLPQRCDLVFELGENRQIENKLGSLL
jgi:D-glycerate 3-kinase